MKIVEENIKPSMLLQTEFDEWVQNGCDKVKELIETAEDKK